MSTPNSATISAFIHAQVQAWNQRDKKAFLAAYRKIAPGKLTIEYVGRSAPADGWAVLEQMWENTNAIVDIEEVILSVNGSEAACHNINHMPSRDMKIHTVELYAFDGDDVNVRYFVKQ